MTAVSSYSLSLFVPNSIKRSFHKTNQFSAQAVHSKCSAESHSPVSLQGWHSLQILPIHSNWLPQPLFIQQTRSAHSITTQYLVPSDGHYVQLCQSLAISSAALQTDRFTLKGRLDKVTTSANLQLWGCEILGLIQLIVYSVMNTAAHSDHCSMETCDWLNVQISL